jgi:hypothetical protein
MNKLALITILGALCVGALATVAQAAQFKVFIDSGTDIQFVGHVEGKSNCLEGRKVTLYFSRQGKDKKIGSDKTFEGKGDTIAWIVKTSNDNLADGKYYAKVKETGDCPGGKSKKYEYPPSL